MPKPYLRPSAGAGKISKGWLFLPEELIVWEVLSVSVSYCNQVLQTVPDKRELITLLLQRGECLYYAGSLVSEIKEESENTDKW